MKVFDKKANEVLNAPDDGDNCFNFVVEPFKDLKAVMDAVVKLQPEHQGDHQQG